MNGTDYNNVLQKIIETQKHILKEVDNLSYGNEKRTTFGDRIASKFVRFLGSWKFILIQSTGLALWIMINSAALIYHWDTYPFILLNLLLSFQAAYATPFILMSSNLAERKDRRKAVDAYRSIHNIETMMERLHLHIDEARCEGEQTK